MEMERCDRREGMSGEKKQMSTRGKEGQSSQNTRKENGVGGKKVERDEMTEARMQTKEEEG